MNTCESYPGLPHKRCWWPRKFLSLLLLHRKRQNGHKTAVRRGATTSSTVRESAMPTLLGVNRLKYAKTNEILVLGVANRRNLRGMSILTHHLTKYLIASLKGARADICSYKYEQIVHCVSMIRHNGQNVGPKVSQFLKTFRKWYIWSLKISYWKCMLLRSLWALAHMLLTPSHKGDQFYATKLLIHHIGPIWQLFF